MASDTTTPSSDAPTKAQAEFDRYARRRAEGFRDDLSWNVPLGVGMAHVRLGGPGTGDTVRDVERAAGSVAEGLGTTVRLGVDLLNAALANSVKILGGFTGAYGAQQGYGCGCEPSCCEPECCEPDCCGCECCSPGVGSCC